MKATTKSRIAAVPQPDCALCGGAGIPVYDELQDRLFGAPGKWNLVRCENHNCGLVWLNPMPKAEEIGYAYETYYTHSNSSKTANPQERVDRQGLWQWLLNVSGDKARKRRAFLLYLDDKAPGRLLEIGCGDGRRLLAFKSLGWEVVGQETDSNAAESVRRIHGLHVLVGPIEEQALPDQSFDAIIMNHVIEHVHAPVDLMWECIRLLKPGGALSVVTPNNESLGHCVFKQNWRGLEPPRHLYIYSMNTLKNLASQAGFQQCSVKTTAINAAGTVTQESFRLRKLAHAGNDGISPLKLKLASRLFKMLETCLLPIKKTVGEEVVLLARRHE